MIEQLEELIFLNKGDLPEKTRNSSGVQFRSNLNNPSLFSSTHSSKKETHMGQLYPSEYQNMQLILAWNQGFVVCLVDTLPVSNQLFSSIIIPASESLLDSH